MRPYQPAVFERPQVATLVSRLAEPPSRIIALFGPRQTGKTTIVEQALQQVRQSGKQGSRYVAVDKPDFLRSSLGPDSFTASAGETAPLPQVRDAEWLVRQWKEARHEAEQPGRSGFVLALDEIQKIPQWSETVKGLWDADRAKNRPLHVVIVGSAPLLMQKGLNESLAGRFEMIRVNHWSFPEMSSAFGFDLSEYLYFGGYPGSARMVREPDRWRDYVLHAIAEPNIERDILTMTRVDKPVLLKRLFELGVSYSGQILSYNKMLGQLQDAGNTTTLARYLDLLSKVGLVAGLPKYSGKPHIRKRSSPKLNVLNTALMTAESGYFYSEAKADRAFWGCIVESAVGAHLLNTASSALSVHYWREGDNEVDFVLKRGPRLAAVEVKSGPRPRRAGGRPSKHRGLAEFEKRFKPTASLLVGAGGVSLNEFLSAPANEWLTEA